MAMQRLQSACFSAVLAISMATAATAQLRPANFKASERPTGVVVTLTTQGPVPKEISRKEGPFLLFVDNRTGVKDLDVVLTKDRDFRADQNGKKPDELDRGKHGNGKNDKLYVWDPHPGTYYLTVDGRPDWNLRITIVP